jgi:monofunctional biosynthetic peptidoglycan transglycosylase
MTIEDDFESAPDPNVSNLRRGRHWDWLMWILAVIVLGPVLWVGIYRFVNPPVTLRMVLTSSKPIDRQWEPLARISPNLIDAAIAGEDSNFCIHHGFDIAAIRAAWKHNEESKTTRGASTISMQTAQNAFLWPDRNWVRKGLEAYFTVLMEHLWPKQRIMEVYLNIAQWGDGIYGAEAASQHYFHHPAALLTSGEAARLAAVLPDPVAWSPVNPAPAVVYRASIVQERADIVHADGLSRCTRQ